ncbi:class I SAM-dependent methyltransferase [Tautonia sociabilis]|uniref:Class I SAM-dependent methyltransferase n=1 Tax=Tautonia sociabilis TaxID=2080755 RepID=A0A432MDS3_9BACT|nr:class I SAM-dependent methyltransferase [Tautonia sociabilis]
MSMARYTYEGSELDLFADARVWKSTLARELSRALGPEVLEVGAGFGGTTRFLCRAEREHRRWVCLEPDAALASRLGAAIAAGELPACCRVKVGTTADLVGDPLFDTVLYIDVMEHIEQDAEELSRAASLLRPGGHVAVLSPAHQWLYTPFDRAIGHHRRYSKRTLAALTPPELEPVRLAYLDTAGLLASLGNRFLLRSAMPTPSQVAFWDRYLVRASRVLDPAIGYRAGKSVLGIWRRREG